MHKIIVVCQTNDGQPLHCMRELQEEPLLQDIFQLKKGSSGEYSLADSETVVTPNFAGTIEPMAHICRQKNADYLIRIKARNEYQFAPGLLQRLIEIILAGPEEYGVIETSRFFLYDFIVEIIKCSCLARILPLQNHWLPNGRLNYLQAKLIPFYLEPCKEDLSYYLIDNFNHYYAQPRAAALDIIMTCNLKCTKCCFHGENGPKWSKRRKPDEQLLISQERYYAIAEKMLAARKDLYLVFSNAGEPTLHPELIPFIRYIKENGGRIQITTNGTQLTPAMNRQLVELGVDNFMISFGAFTQETYEKTHIGGNFSRTKSNIESLLQTISDLGAEETVKVNMHFVVEPQNQHETEDYVAYWLDRAGVVSVHQLNDLFSEYAKFANKSHEPEKRFPCQVLWTSFNVHNNGDIVYCCCWNRDNDQENIFNKPVQDFWNGEKIQEIRKAHVEGNYGIMDQCLHCDSWMVLPRELEMTDRYYAEEDPIQRVYRRLPQIPRKQQRL